MIDIIAVLVALGAVAVLVPTFAVIAALIMCVLVTVFAVIEWFKDEQ